ncbi:polysaccharide biosynthesis C-terminal domain-containing protein [Liquorilactobacillus oeni]|uniref:Oligosaccharide translocase n=1 Tax=Liquorilactobacillus oeni DSM 19972 TaxID=1423777 RepID=A0A0R1MMB3_9LACO|nr:polysaccharide biosynthesis C-terminal domain-containing protein [Liquorilactobacillus oeni]KRL05747.1 oligosaccharide translocase [Liquorilactobacillus oeni DSM 19972]
MKVFRNYFYNAGYQILAMILPLITSPYITRVLGRNGVGINSFTNSLIQYFVLFGSIGIGLYGNREIAFVRDDRQKLSQTFWEIAILKALTVTIAYAVFLLFLVFYHEYRSYMLLQSIYIIAAGIDISWLFMGLEDFKKTVIRNTLVKVLSVILIFTFVKDAGDTGKYILILAGSIFFGNLTLWPYLKKTVTAVDWKKLNIFKHLRPAVILFVPQIAIQVYLVLNKTMLGLIINSDYSGFFDRSDNIVRVVLSLATATGTVMLPHVANAFSKGDNKRVKYYLSESFDFVSFLTVPLTFGLAALAVKFAPWFYGAEFQPVGNAMMLESAIILLIGWSNVIGQQYLLPTNQIKSYSTSVIMGAIVNIIANVPLIYLFGLQGAVFATVLSELAVTGYQLWKIRGQVKFRELFVNVPKYLIAGIIMFLAVFKVNSIQNFGILAILMQVLLGTTIYIVVLLILRPTILKKIRSIIENYRVRK